MDFVDRLNAISARIPIQEEHIKTEEATKNAFIMPFIAALGYDVFNPMEVVPEYTADVGIKKGEKVDYAIMREGKPIIIFETKWSGADLSKEHKSQLHRYFGVVHSRIAVLTNGVRYEFYADIDEPNKMDSHPFLELDMLDIQDSQITELKKLTKTAFDVDEMVSAASELKYLKQIKAILETQFNEPSVDFVKFFASQVHAGPLRGKIVEKFTKFTKRAFHQFISQKINDRFKGVLVEQKVEDLKVEEEAVKEKEEIEADDGIVTTEEELEGFHIVKSIVREVVDLKRILYRDTKSYFGILFDDNNRKPVCRLHFNSAINYIGLFGEDKKETRIPLEDLNDIYKHSDALKAKVIHYVNTQSGPGKRPSERLVKSDSPLDN